MTWTHTGAVHGVGRGRAQLARHWYRPLLLQVPKSAHARAVRDEIAGAGGAG